MKYPYILFSILTVMVMIISCGEGIVDIDESRYKPKIVIQGYLFPENKVEKIFITRNMPLSETVRWTFADILIPDADVRIRDMQNDSVYSLTYNPYLMSYEYTGADLQIGYGKSYRIEVQAMIDSILLSARSVTRTPEAGFRIRKHESKPDSMPYRLKVADSLQFFKIRFDRSPNCGFYLFSYTALDADSSTFVYSPVNPFADPDTQEVVKNLRYFKHTSDFILNAPLSFGISEKPVLWFSLWFYGNYRAIIYATDANFRNYYLTYNDVQEFDGNFHEPKMNIQGDGIGVFGSAIADTFYFKVLRTD